MVLPKTWGETGCPISEYLFIMAVELLVISIKENDSIGGNTVEGTEIQLRYATFSTCCS